MLQLLANSAFQTQINLLSHLKQWIDKENTHLHGLLKTKQLQEALNATLQALSSDYLREYGCLLESAPLYSN